MANLTDFLKSSTAKGAYGQPGSNGFWQRDVFAIPGTYTWTARKAGNVKVQGLGAACGAKGRIPGNSAGWGEKTLAVTAGQTLTIVVGAGSAGVIEASTPANAGSTSISGTPVGGTPLTLTGATATAAGAASGPWDISFPGAATNTPNIGGPSSGSPFGPGKVNPGSSSHGAGWGGGAGNTGPGSSHRAGFDTGGASFAPIVTAGLTSREGNSRDIWDMHDADSAAPAAAQEYSGPGAGGRTISNSAGQSVMGGGTAQYSGTSSRSGLPGGFGAGGGASAANDQAGGPGGSALVFVFYDEVF